MEYHQAFVVGQATGLGSYDSESSHVSPCTEWRRRGAPCRLAGRHLEASVPSSRRIIHTSMSTVTKNMIDNRHRQFGYWFSIAAPRRCRGVGLDTNARR